MRANVFSNTIWESTAIIIIPRARARASARTLEESNKEEDVRQQTEEGKIMGNSSGEGGGAPDRRNSPGNFTPEYIIMYVYVLK